VAPLYITACPGCGQQLEPHAGHPDSTPWTCHNCHVGFWKCELSAEARAMYRPRFHDWGHSEEAFALHDAAEAERELARERGTSCLPEHVGLLESEHLLFLHERFPLSDDFRKRIQAALQ
jgi:hypothetical protein